MGEESLVPAPGWVLIKPLDEVKKVGVLTMDNANKEETTKGRVIGYTTCTGITQAGAIIDPEDFDLQGHTIVHKKYGAHEVEYAGEKLRLVHLENIIAIIK